MSKEFFDFIRHTTVDVGTRLATPTIVTMKEAPKVLLEATKKWTGWVCHISGKSGSGKTTLVEQLISYNTEHQVHKTASTIIDLDWIGEQVDDKWTTKEKRFKQTLLMSQKLITAGTSHNISVLAEGNPIPVLVYILPTPETFRKLQMCKYNDGMTHPKRMQQWCDGWLAMSQLQDQEIIKIYRDHIAQKGRHYINEAGSSVYLVINDFLDGKTVKDIQGWRHSDLLTETKNNFLNKIYNEKNR